MRADKWLLSAVPSLTRRQAVEALERGLVKGRNGEILAKGVSLQPDSLPDLERLNLHLEKLHRGNSLLKCSVIHEHPEFWIIDKPAGMPSHPLGLFEIDTVTHWAFAQDVKVARAFTEIQPTIVPHRLDIGTSGLQVVTKNRESFEKWREYFSTKQIQKKYFAWCWGNPTEQEFTISQALTHDPADEKRMLASELGRGAPIPAESIAKPVKLTKDKFLAEVTCKTGATHQVRVHLASLGFPLVGDKIYDSLFVERDTNPPWHLLRAIFLKTPEGDFVSDNSEFEKLYN